MSDKTSKNSGKVAKKADAERVAPKPTLLAGGNPQIAKADGDARSAERRGAPSHEHFVYH